MRISKTELHRFDMPNILARIEHCKEVVKGLWRKNKQYSDRFYVYQIKKEMLQIRKHVTIMDEYIRRFEKQIK